MPSGFGKCSNYLSFLLQLHFAMNTCKGLPSNSKIFCFLLASLDLQVPMIPLISFEPSFPICLLLWKWREDIILLQSPGATRNTPQPLPPRSNACGNSHAEKHLLTFLSCLPMVSFQKNSLYLRLLGRGQK